MTAASEAPLIYLIAGEPSGDALGGRLMAALNDATEGKVRFAGVGGRRMASAGLESLFPMSDLSVMGLTEVLPRLPKLLSRIGETVRDVEQHRPAALVTIDSPDFTLRVARRLAGKGIPLIHYVAPSVWAWKPGRARKIAAYLDHLLALLPFEPPLFEAEGLKTTFVGHPVVEGGAANGDGARFRARHGISSDAVVLAVLPGSRKSETGRLLPVFGGALERLKKRHPALVLVVPTVETVATDVARAAEVWPFAVKLVTDNADKYDAFAAAAAALAASGSVSLELAAAGTPTVTAYAMNPVTGFFVRRMVRIGHVNLVNILNDDGDVVPEFLFENCEAGKLAGAVATLLEDEAAWARQREGMRAAIAKLTPSEGTPSERAARAVLNAIALG